MLRRVGTSVKIHSMCSYVWSIIVTYMVMGIGSANLAIGARLFQGTLASLQQLPTRQAESDALRGSLPAAIPPHLAQRRPHPLASR